ncbi:MAG: hypothetical protein U0V70_05765 [Terriglobia bacterium]
MQLTKTTSLLPAGDVKVGLLRLLRLFQQTGQTGPRLNDIPIKTVGERFAMSRWLTLAKRRMPTRFNLCVRVDGRRSVYLPIMKRGGDTNTIEVVNGIRELAVFSTFQTTGCQCGV